MAENFKKSPGEVSAITGYGLQYSIFATEIYNILLNNGDQLEWVEFASDQAGKIDDVLIGLSNSILACQVKNISSSPLTFSSFTISKTKSIVEGMFEGWKKLLTDHPGKRIDVRFITTQAASDSDKILSFAGANKPSFKEFLQRIWEPIQEGKYDVKNIPIVWRNTITELQNITKSTADELFQFIKHTHFTFEFSNPGILNKYIERQREIDIEEITKRIFQTVWTKGRTRYTKQEFLRHFNLLNRYESYYTHSFFVDELHYQPIDETINKIEEIVKNNKNGYIALIGNAGSGKSTLITKWIQQTDYKVLKYYAYVNSDMNYQFGYRGEATIFLHDIIVQIRESNQTFQERLPTDKFEDLQKQFNHELNKLSHENRKVIVVVDGLDHIEREQNVSKSLIDILPHPENIPENIFFILGSRTIENLQNVHFSIRNFIKEEDRFVSIQPLPKDRIQKLLETYQIILSEQQLERLFLNTHGHPLFLRYLIEGIVNNIDTLDQIIDGHVFSGDIYKEYKLFWDKNKEQDDFIEILGLISRFRHAFFNIDLVKMFPNITRENRYRINNISENYFFKIGNIWQFFHNSFKEFLVTETARDILTGNFDPLLDAEFHKRLAHASKQSLTDYKWNELYHLYKAGCYGEVIGLVSQDYFRRQWFEFRNYKLIKEDIQLGLNAANKEHNVYCVFKCFLSLFELKQRYNNFDPSQYFECFYQIGNISLANSFVYDNVELLISQNAALEYCVTLFKSNYNQLAKDIFSRAAPSYILNQTKSVSQRRYKRETYEEIDELALLGSWAQAASLFCPIESIFDTISKIEIEENGNSSGHRNLLAEVAEKILILSIDLKNISNIQVIESFLIKKELIEELAELYMRVVLDFDDHSDYYLHCLDKIKNWKVSDNNGTNRAVTLIHLLILKSPQSGGKYFQTLTPPKDIPRNDYSTDEQGIASYIFDYSRFYYIITKEFTKNSEDLSIVHDKFTKTAFYWAFAELGKSYAYLYHGYKGAALGYYTNFKGILSLFHVNHTDYDYEYSVAESKTLLIRNVLNVSNKLSPEVLQTVLDHLTTEWITYKKYWRTLQIQDIIEWAIDLKVNKEWCMSELSKIDQYLFLTGYVDDRISNAVIQVRLWSKLNELQKAEFTLHQIMNIAFNVRGEKDSQLDYIVDKIRVFDKTGSDEVMYYLSRVNSISAQVNSPSHTPAHELLQLSFQYGNGFHIFKYLLFEGLVPFQDGLEVILSYLSLASPLHQRFISDVYMQVILAFDTEHYIRHTYLDELFSHYPKLSTQELKSIVEKIKVYSVSEHCNEYLYKVQEYAIANGYEISHVGLAERLEKPDPYNRNKNRSGDSSNEVSIKRGKLQEVRSWKMLESFKRANRNGEDLDYGIIYPTILQFESNEATWAYLCDINFELEESVKIAKVLIDRKNETFAKEILYHIIENGQKHGWFTYIDGGTKIRPFELLKSIEGPEIFQNRTLSDFCNCVGSFDIQGMELIIKDLVKIWSFFSSDIDVEKLYAEIIIFRTELLKNQQIDERTPSIDNSLNDFDLLVDILFFILTMPSDFNNAIYNSLVHHDKSAVDIVYKLLDKLYEGKFYWKYIKLLAVMATKSETILVINQEKLIQLVNNGRYDITILAHALLNRIGKDSSGYIKPTITEFPLTYQIKFEHQPSLYSTDHSNLDFIDKNNFLKPTEDPLVYVRLYLPEIKYLSQETNIPILNIAHRIIQLGTDSGFPEWCSRISEEELRRIYSGRLKLEVSYKRPRNQMVWDGLMKVLKELLKFDLIDEQLANEINDEFDEYIYLIQAQPKPPFVKSILKKSGSAPSAEEGWAKSLSKEYVAESLDFKFDNNSYILAEYSWMEGMGWGDAREIRQSFISSNDNVQPGDDWEIIFNYASTKYIKLYPKLNDSGIILYNYVRTIDKKRNWLAVNPALCQALGLVLNKKGGNFRWDDKRGNKIVESIYWQLHSTENHDKHHQSETGYGWYVILYKEGYNLFKDLLKDIPIFQHKKIYRHLSYQQEKYKTNLNEDYTQFVSERVFL